jgi:hypothetical protein
MCLNLLFNFLKFILIFFSIPIVIMGQERSFPFINSIGMKMIKIHPGEFNMGNPDPAIDSWDESPLHKVTISQSFYISETEVMLEQYRQFKKDFEGSGFNDPYAAGMNWYDAVAFCEWLSEKEGKEYRLPTEAEWEYVCRAGTSTDFWSGSEPPEEGAANPWGLKNMASGAREWCYDWYGPYPFQEQIDPVGRGKSLVKVVRGGGLDLPSDNYTRSSNRAGMAPSFSILQSQKKFVQTVDDSKKIQGLVGLYFGDPVMKRFDETDVISKLQYNWKKEGISPGNDWSAIWEGMLTAPATGEITIFGRTDRSLTLTIDGKEVLRLDNKQKEGQGKIELQVGRDYPVKIEYTHDGGDDIMELKWKWDDNEFRLIPAENIFYTKNVERKILRNYGDTEVPGQHRIGFRVVQGKMPSTKPLPEFLPFVRQCVAQENNNRKQGPDPSKPWFKRRELLPIPPDNEGNREVIRRAGFHLGIMGHNHSPSVEVLPNGDILFVIYTSEHEYEPEVSLMATRLRFGSDEWDFPEIMVNFPDVNDHAPLLWTDNNRIYLFWGNPRYPSAYPFQWVYSDDNGVTWSEVQFPIFENKIGPHNRQPINTAFHDDNGIIYIASDAIDATSVLWASSNNGQTWYDTEGRSAGRHTTYAPLKDGKILGMGGKNSNVDGYMPKAVSTDGGKTWKVSKTPFASLGSNQRPSLLRLQSGRLFFAGDFQHRNGDKPDGIEQSGSYVALSEDEGKTWHIKKVTAALPHEADQEAATIGYSAARQAPNGIIHLVTSMNNPCLHFEMNEAWILSKSEIINTEIPVINDVKSYETKYPSGKTKRVWKAGIGADGRYLLHGGDNWFYENGKIQWEVTYEAGQKIGEEKYFSEDENILWSWNHKKAGLSFWSQYYRNGNLKAVSFWKDGRLSGIAKIWDINGKLISETKFNDGKAGASAELID